MIPALSAQWLCFPNHCAHISCLWYVWVHFLMCNLLLWCSTVLAANSTHAHTHSHSQSLGENIMSPGSGRCQKPKEWALYSLLANKLVPLAAADHRSLVFFFLSPLTGPFVKVDNGGSSNRRQVSVNVWVCAFERKRADASLPDTTHLRLCLCKSLAAYGVIRVGEPVLPRCRTMHPPQIAVTSHTFSFLACTLPLG